MSEESFELKPPSPEHLCWITAEIALSCSLDACLLRVQVGGSRSHIHLIPEAQRCERQLTLFIYWKGNGEEQGSQMLVSYLCRTLVPGRTSSDLQELVWVPLPSWRRSGPVV